ncbi:class I SAM-dependent methyltransferase [Pseudenhygromyxa sp. WMMC2535]|uniref:methyltransferase domain-containing protein n=1 Tax=Pseudenhygromyxa sp. WMMC2535 TaxID=2712867 RepID=UPI001554FC04|nr:class I SAM-dependent methyltransferase [Pseudenhygromyxa sp. WMMC2535]
MPTLIQARRRSLRAARASEGHPIPRDRHGDHDRGRGRRSMTLPALLGLLSTLGLASASACKDQSESHPPQHYGDKEEALARFEEPERDAWAKPGQVVDALAVAKTMDVADIGAGSGYFTRRLAHAASAGTTYAVDVDADFKTHIETHRDDWGTPNIETRLAVYEHPLLPKESVDLVFISNTYSFLQERVAYFTAVHTALRPRGRLAVIDWRTEADCPRSLGCPKPKQRVPKELALRELSQAGFVVLEDHDFLEYQYFLILGRVEDQAAAEPPPEPDAAATDGPTDVDTDIDAGVEDDAPSDDDAAATSDEAISDTNAE